MIATALRYEQTPFSLGLQPQHQLSVAPQAAAPHGGEVVVAERVQAVPRQMDAALAPSPSVDGDAQTCAYEPLEPAVVLPAQRETDRNLLPLQQWEGVVTRVLSDEFTITLRDLTHPGSPEEEATVPVAEVTLEDRRLLVPGAVLYWSIGYQTIRASGQVQRVSDIRLRRLPAWSKRDLERVAQRARVLRDNFGSDDSDDATSTR
jgi:phage FluMu protein gp41